jgi:hypothetical protein
MTRQTDIDRIYDHPFAAHAVASRMHDFLFHRALLGGLSLVEVDVIDLRCRGQCLMVSESFRLQQSDLTDRQTRGYREETNLVL